MTARAHAVRRPPDEMTAADAPTGHQGPRSIRVRLAELALAPAGILLHALGRLDEPDLAAMALVCLAMLVEMAVVGALAGRPARGYLAARLMPVSMVLHLVGCAVLVHLAGGVAGPIGALVYCALPFIATRYPSRALLAYCAVAVAGYVTVAVVGATSPPGYAFVYTFLFLALTLRCARHARSVTHLDERLAGLARSDPLTGCLNRRGFDERLQVELARSHRSGRPVSLVHVDLDAFKAVNDTHGHDAGDRLLEATARALRDSGRAQDAVGRLGGDEFAVILPDTDGAGAEAVVARLRRALDGWSPASMGVASAPAEATSATDLHHLADQRLYTDKAARAASAPPTAPGPRAAVVPAVAPCDATPGPDDVCRTARRLRRMAGSMGWLAVTDFGIALLYVGLFAGAGSHRSTMAGLLLAGLALGVGLVGIRRHVRRPRTLGTVMVVTGAAQFGVTSWAVALDGGLASPLAVGLLVPFSFIALSMRPRLAIAVMVPAVALYVALALLVGAPSSVYVASHLMGAVSIAALCMAQWRRAADARRQLTALSRIDSLTGCLNRRGFDERSTDELARAVRTGTPLSLFVLDLDGFKERNDSAGHAAGDELLQWVGTVLGNLVRSHDLVGRLGGDEFGALLPDCNAHEAGRIADRVRSTLAERTSVSVGTATMGPDGTDFASLYRSADGRLYAEKRSRSHRAVGGREPTLGGEQSAPAP